MKPSKLPIQAAPVERTITGAPMSTEGGVDPSFSWGSLGSSILDAVKTYGPGIVKGVAGLL